MVSCIVDGAHDGARVYDVLRMQLGVSDGCVRRAKHVPGGIQLDGAPERANAPVCAGQQVALAIDAPGMPGSFTDMAPQEGPMEAVYCDDDVLVVDKPAGLVIYPSPGHPDGTLANRVVAWLLAQGRRCGVHAVQRLDAGTSGLVVFALHSFAKERMAAQLHTEAFVREYVAVCEGWLEPDAGFVDVPVGLLSCSPNVFGATPEGKPAVTRFQVVERGRTPAGEPCSLVRLRLETGRTHQIRIHMAHVGHPLLGDDAYGRASGFIARPALHSQRVSFAHPVTGERVSCEAPLPRDIAALM